MLPCSLDAQDRAPARAALEEIIVTATRVETNLQETPMSIHAFSGEDLDLAGIDAGRDLGIMVPNVVINPGCCGEFATSTFIRGLPGVTTYVDGVNFYNVGFLQRSFVEIERVEVLRGPQGTLFGRNTNGGAIQILTRRPADEFGARLDVELGEFEQRTLALAVDLPLTDRLTIQMDCGARPERRLHGEPNGSVHFGRFRQYGAARRFSLGAHEPRSRCASTSTKRTATAHLRGSCESRTRKTPSTSRTTCWPATPITSPRRVRSTPRFRIRRSALPFDRFTPETHQQGYPGGQLGKWQTRSDTPGPTVIDQQFATVTVNWEITPRLALESLTAYLDSRGSQIAPYDGSEFTHSTDMIHDHYEGVTQELHLVGDFFEGRLQSMFGLYYNDNSVWGRPQSWWFWEFAIPNTGPNPGTPGPPGVGGRPLVNLAARDYVRAWGATVGNSAVASFSPPTFVTTDRLLLNEWNDRALFGELTIGLRDKLDLIVGFRFAQADASSTEYLPASAFRPVQPGTEPVGDLFAVAGVIQDTFDQPDFGTISTPKVAVTWRPTDDVFLYASYAEGYTSSAIVNSPFVPDPINLDPEIIETREIGLRSDFLDQRLRFNATLFSSRWDGLRVPKRLDDPNNPGQPLPQGVPTSDGVAATSGLEVELFYVPGERWELDFSLGLLDSEYLDIGDPPANRTGLQPGIPLQYAPETELLARPALSLTARARRRAAVRRQLRMDGRVSARWAERVPDQGC